MYPPAETYDTVPNDGTLARVSMFATGAIYDTYGSHFDYGPVATTIYPSTGSTIDYMYHTEKTPCPFAVELRDTGRYGFLLPEDQIMEVVDEMYPAYRN
jgi:murein tripeptide amidase MpaA